MNIIQVCPYDLSIPGGVQTHVAHLSNHLVKKNHNVLVISPSTKHSAKINRIDAEVCPLTESRRIGIWGTSIDISYLNASERGRFSTIVEQFKPDVVHFHTIWNPVMQFQMLYMLNGAVTKVATFHDTPPDTGLGKYIGGNLMKLGSGYVIDKLDESISVSESQARAMGYEPGDYPPCFRVIPNGIDNTIIREVKDAGARHEPGFTLIFIGRFEERKGIFDLLQVFRKLKAEHPGRKLNLHVVGNGPLEPNIRRFIDKHNLTGVTLFRDVDDPKKLELLGAADLLAAPSLYGESFGIVLLEAMAMGVKVVGYGNEGYLNIGREYGVENFPEPGNRDKLYARIRRHILQPETTEHLIEKGFEIARRHDWKRITNRIERVYRNGNDAREY
ncbi:MAG: glycosyltransferase family 4 protein [Balneolaceae bacterium]|nr:glycosyltransferase family 4 protein [Balneolaceae bacterium]